MGDIGEPLKHIELEPLEVPLEVPVPEKEPEKVQANGGGILRIELRLVQRVYEYQVGEG